MKHVHETRNYVSFEKWKKDYEDIPYIKQNYKRIHEEIGIPKEAINGGDDFELSPHTTIAVRVFKHGGFYEICLNSQYYLILCSEDWMEDTTEVIEKELYEWCCGEIFESEVK